MNKNNVQSVDYEQNNLKSYAKIKIGNSLNAKEQFLAEFYAGLTREMYFRITR